MKKLIYTVLAVALASTFTPSQAQFGYWFKKKKAAVVAADTTANKTPKKSAYEKLLAGKCESSYGKLISFHKTAGKIYAEIPFSTLNKEMLLASTITSVSQPAFGMVGYKNTAPKCTKFVRYDSTVILQWLNSDFLYDTADARIKNVMEKSRAHASIMAFKIQAFNKDSSALVVDMSPLFLKDEKLFRIISRSLGRSTIIASQKDDLTFVNSVKAFDDNATVKVERGYLVNIGDAKAASVENFPATVFVTYTMMLLPQEKMTPRIADTRVGIFQSGKLTVDPLTKEIREVSIVNRWKVEPSDEAAFAAGKLVEPKKPILFYVDNMLPNEWKQPLKVGVLRWNEAFEKIGFKNVVQVKDFPVNDSTFDPDNLKYNCIRYVPTQEENAMGPSWVDPRTGEIINASTFVYNNVVELINKWRFVQTAQLEPKVRARNISKDLLDESLAYVFGHEIGHTLGMMHNMGASSAFAVDSLRSASFTQKYGTTPSIMDYARFNYVAQPTDKGVKLTPPNLGVYDDYAIEWTYKYFTNTNKDYWKEAKLLDDFVAAHEGNKLYRYGLQQLDRVQRFDPSSIEEDLGDDPIKASTYGMKNLRYIIDNIENWIKDDEATTYKTDLYDEIATQAYRYISNVFMNVGGIYLTQASEKSGVARFKSVSKETQRASLKFLLQQARVLEDFGNKALEKKMYASNKVFSTIASIAQKMAATSVLKTELSYYIDSTSYSPAEYMEDAYKDIFAKTIAKTENLTKADKDLQRAFIKILKDAYNSVTGGGSGEMLHNDDQILIDKVNQIVYGSAGTHTCCFKNGSLSAQKLEELMQPNAADINVDKDVQTLGLNTNFGNGYGGLVDIWTTTVTRALKYMVYYTSKTQTLLKQAIQTTKNPELKLHYMYLLKKINESTKDTALAEE